MTAQLPTKTETAHIIVFGNEKGGSGKSTTAMHTAIALARLGYKVATIDLDARQGTLTRYMQNRRNYSDMTGHPLPLPPHRAISQSIKENGEDQRREERQFVTAAIEELSSQHDFIIIDTPGTDNHLSRLGHAHADTLVTPLNDSLVDLDVLARIDPKSHEILKPSVYTLMVEEQNLKKIEDGGVPMHWIVMRNRLSSLNARNKRDIGVMLEKLGAQIGFALVAGFGERVIFRELFLKGLTLLDLKEEEISLTLSQLAARQEVRQLIRAIGPEKIKGYVKPPA